MALTGSQSDTLPQFTGVYVFGDSLVDPGNALKAAQLVDDFPFTSLPSGAPTASKGYFEGRFSDGYNFADLISNKLISQPTQPTFPYGFEDPIFGLSIPFVSRPDGDNLSFAYGGAQVRRGDEYVPDLDDQTDIYRNYPSADPAALYMITIGGNDIREMAPRSGAPLVGEAATARLNDVAGEIVEEIGQLFGFGARHILWTGIPDVGLIPEYKGAVDEATLRALATGYSEQLDALVKSGLASLPLPAGATLHTFSLGQASDEILANPAAYNLTNVTDARTSVQAGALQPVGSGFLFFDAVHPSAQAHAIVAGAILDSLRGPGGDAGEVAPAQLGPRLLGAVEATGGLDEFKVSLLAGQDYTLDLQGVSSGSGSLADPRLQIVSQTGAILASDDDSGLGLDAHLRFIAPATEEYTVRASAVGAITGTYVLLGAGLRGSDVTVLGGPSGDVISAIGGANYLRGDAGADTITGGSGFDDINGNTGDDSAAGGPGDDWVVGGKDNDVLHGDAGGDVVWGNLGADTLDGGDGADQVRGGQGDDIVNGGAGGDYVSGDRGNDTITGGAGADLFHGSQDAGIDRVLDFSLAEGDRVMLDPGTTYTVGQVGADTVIDMGGGHQMILVGMQFSTLTAGWIFEA
jgi:phospholipase/lecithinase/hemolysin